MSVLLRGTLAARTVVNHLNIGTVSDYGSAIVGAIDRVLLLCALLPASATRVLASGPSPAECRVRLHSFRGRGFRQMYSLEIFRDFPDISVLMSLSYECEPTDHARWDVRTETLERLRTLYAGMASIDSSRIRHYIVPSA